MAELLAVAFQNPPDADRVLTALREMQQEHLVDLKDAVVAIRQPAGRQHSSRLTRGVVRPVELSGVVRCQAGQRINGIDMISSAVLRAPCTRV